MPDDELRELRQAEQRAALAELGLSIEVEFLRFPDGRLEANLELRRALTAVIRRYKPATVFTHDPTAHIFPSTSITPITAPWGWPRSTHSILPPAILAPFATCWPRACSPTK